MSFAGWVVAVALGVFGLLLMALGITLDQLRRTKEKLEEVKRAKDDLQHRLADMVATVELAFSDDPDLDGDAESRLRAEIAAASPAVGGAGRGDLSAVEQAAADRIRGAAAARAGREG